MTIPHLRALESQATRGPWTVRCSFAGKRAGNGGEDGWKLDCPRVPDLRCLGGSERPEDHLTEDDATLIVALRNSAPLSLDCMEWVLGALHHRDCRLHAWEADGHMEHKPVHVTCTCGLDALRERLESME